MKLVLGSSSPFRKKILEDAGIDFEVVAPDIDEKKIRGLDHEHTPVLLAYAKAEAVAKKLTEPAIIIACDQVVVCNGHILEKPANADEVRAWHKMYSQYPVYFINGITVLNTASGVSITGQQRSVSTFAPIPEEFTERQIQEGTILQCSGAIGEEIERAYGTILEGSLESMIGLPLDFVLPMIEKVK